METINAQFKTHYNMKKKITQHFPIRTRYLIVAGCFLALAVRPVSGSTAVGNKDYFNLDKKEDIRISGVVVDEEGNPLIGATIMVEGTTVGTVTDLAVSYELNVPEDGVLDFSYVGFDSQKIPVDNRQTINVTLKFNASSLDEVVVVGYGQQKRASVTGSVADISSQDIKSIPTPNVVTGLAGRLPGLRVTQRNGEPGSYATSFDIRGFGSPLIVIDGIVRDSGSFARLDPNDIENISVLKDA